MLAQTSYGIKGTYTVYIGRDTLETMRNMGFEFEGDRPVCHVDVNDGVVYLHKSPTSKSRRRYLSLYRANGDESWTIGFQPNGQMPPGLRDENWGRSEVHATHGTDFIRIPPPAAENRKPAPVGKSNARVKEPEKVELPFTCEVRGIDGGSFSFGLNFMQGLRLREWLREQAIPVED